MRYFFAIAAILVVGPALAQEIPEGQSCGGLFCDLGILGHKTAPPAAAPAPAAKAVPAAAPVPDATASVAEPRKRIVRRKRAAPVAVAVMPAVVKPAAASAPVAPASVAAVPVTPVVAASPVKKPPPAPPVSAPPSDEPVVSMDPAIQTPVGAEMFQPIYR